jgi:hypothetical protein
MMRPHRWQRTASTMVRTRVWIEAESVRKELLSSEGKNEEEEGQQNAKVQDVLQRPEDGL